MQAFSSCGKQRQLSSCAVQAFHCGGFSYCGARDLGCVCFSSCGSQPLEHRLHSCVQAQLLRSMWDLPGGAEPVSPALAGGFFTTERPGKPHPNCSNHIYILGTAIRRCVDYLPFLFLPVLLGPMYTYNQDSPCSEGAGDEMVKWGSESTCSRAGHCLVAFCRKAEEQTKIAKAEPGVSGSAFSSLGCHCVSSLCVLSVCTVTFTRILRKLQVIYEGESASCSTVSDSLRPHGLEPATLLCAWDSPGKNTGVGCHSLLQRMFLTQESNPVFCIAGRYFTIWATRESFIEIVSLI